MIIDIQQEYERLQGRADRGEINQGVVYAVIEAHAMNQGGKDWKDLIPEPLRRKSIPSPGKRMCPHCHTEHYGPLATCWTCFDISTKGM